MNDDWMSYREHDYIVWSVWIVDEPLDSKCWCMSEEEVENVLSV